jgi:predicted TIM-barrel fold metal-dependent hydrolase
VILAHPSVPWQGEAISMATHKANVFIDLSGWAPKYFPSELVRAAGGMLKRKVLFGSDYPLITPERWIEDFSGLGLKDEVLPGILKHNALGVLGLS